jgi:ribosome biogenesis GTPase
MNLDTSGLGRRDELTAELAATEEDDLTPARVLAQHRGLWLIASPGAPPRLAPARGRLRGEPPVTGDWVCLDRNGTITRVLERRTALVRRVTDSATESQVLAANVDVALIVVALADPPLRPGLIDRCLVALHRGGVRPAVCANKVDLLDAAGRRELETLLAPYHELGVPVLACSADTGEGTAALRAFVAGKAVVLLGHSGVGKSSLANALDPDGSRRTGAVRDYDGRGRHTTSASSLRRLADGTRLIDTPGVRAFGLEAPSADELRSAFAEFAPFAARCRFRDCTHAHEPDCGVRAAVAAGLLSAARVASFCRLLADP